ncbi:MAG: lytic transglycosylase F [Bacteroidetes bacterium]|nr:MAG: lytic transglycosylase F [Bacteroidota bacterium]
MKQLIFVLLFFLSFLIACGPQHTPSVSGKEHSDENRVLDSVLQRKKLKAVTDYGSVTYLIYRGETIGYQYEMLKDFTTFLGVELEMVTEKDLEKSIDMLNNGEADLLAMGLTVTNDRAKVFEFTEPIMTTHQVLVQRKPDKYLQMATADEIESHLIRNQIDLAGKTIYVQKGTIFASRLATLADEIGDTIIIIQEDKDVEELIEAVANKEIDYTVADEHIALVNSKYYPNIDIKTPLSFPQKIAWAAKKGQTGLTDTINSWLAGYLKSIKSRLVYNKYFKNIRTKRIAQSRYNSFSGNHLSPYDEYIKEAGKLVGWDWRLLASLIYQESEFKPNVRSWVGAYGLMQMMPSTLEKYGLDTTATAYQQIIAGTRYLKHLDKQLPEDITDSVERIKFVMASYNAGIAHVFDARRLAEKYGKDPNIWTGNVDFFMLNLSDKYYYHDPVVYYGYVRGKETYDFVNEIFIRFEDYRNLIPKE